MDAGAGGARGAGMYAKPLLPPLQGLSHKGARGLKRKLSPLEACTAQWNTMLEEAISMFGPPLLELCKPVPRLPQPFIKYEHQFCGKNFIGMRDDHMGFIIEAKRVLNAPGSKLAYTFTVKMSLDTFPEREASQLLQKRMGEIGLSHEKQVSLDAWRRQWEMHPDDARLAAAIRAKLVGILVPWLKFFRDLFTYEEK